jgi:hypothetical protein
MHNDNSKKAIALLKYGDSIFYQTGSVDEKKNQQSEIGRLDKDWIPSKETKQSKVEEEQEKEVGEENELTSTSKTAKPYALNTLHKHAKIGVCGTKPRTVQ